LNLASAWPVDPNDLGRRILLPKSGFLPPIGLLLPNAGDAGVFGVLDRTANDQWVCALSGDGAVVEKCAIC
jgi:hypothetical protein